MADDLAIEAPFAATFPLPFRVMLLGGLGLLCWATNLHGLQLLGIDAADALELKAYDGFSSLAHPVHSTRALYDVTYKLFYAYSTWSFVGWAFFRYCTRGDFDLVDRYKATPAIFFLLSFMVLICPFNIFHKRERDQFLV